MDLLIKDRIKEYRKRKKITQEALAEVLGISPQSISKWECGEGYPDITLLPSIANYFGITIDELIGNDELSAKRDIEENFFGVLHLITDDERLELALKYHKKYPRDWHIATVLMHEITRNHRDKLDEYRQYLYTLCERLLEECHDSVLRNDAVRSVCMICDEKEIDGWLSRDSVFIHDEKHAIYEERYALEEDLERCSMYKAVAGFLQMSKGLSKILSNRNYVGDAQKAVSWNEKYIRLLDAACARIDDNVPDGWLAEYAEAYLRLSAAHFGSGSKDKGYKFLEMSIIFAERFDGIPDGALLELGNEMFYADTRAVKGKEYLVLPDGKEISHLSGISELSPNIAKRLESPIGWDWLDSVRNEERFLALLERAKLLA